MKKLLFALACFCLITSHAQKAIITGNFKGLAEGTKVFLIPEFDGPKDSAIARQGKFTFTIAHCAGNIYSIRFSRDFVPGKWQDFYVQPGQLNINSDDSLLVNYSFTGSPYALDYNDFITIFKKQGLAEKQYDISRKTALADATHDTSLARRTYREYCINDSLGMVAEIEWARAHPASPLSSFFVYRRQMEISGALMKELYTTFTATAKDNALGTRLAAKVTAFTNNAIGAYATLFTQADTAGKPVALKSFRGKYVLLDFWASWCGPCREENPNVVKAFAKYKEKGFTVLSVSLDDKKEKWLDAIHKDGMPWTHVSDLKNWENAVAVKYDITGVPSNFLIDRDGKIVAQDLRGEELTKKLAEIFE